MAKNDVVLLDSILEQRVAEGLPSNRADEVFEYFALEQVLKDFDLSRDELERGWIDGRDDGGIDAFFIFINGHYLHDPTTFAWPKTGAMVEIYLFTCKHHATFEQAPINSLVASAQELLDLSLSPEQLKGSYSEEVLKARALLVLAYRRVSIAKPEITFRFLYVSRGNTTEVSDNVLARAKQLQSMASSFFSSCTARFDFVGATELITLFRRTKQFSLDLPFIEHVSAGGGSYILLARLDDYCHFVSDNAASLRRYLFDSNVRDFVRGSAVNDDIAESLRTPSAPDFWWLNNGVTILATNAALSGKTISLQNIQIVNGLQTTETIFRHFGKDQTYSDSRTVLIKVLVSTDPLVRDRIIRATNNQNAVELASLHATDKIQRDIEDILEKHDWYYERRKNYYRNIGKPPQRFVTPLYLASCVVALVFKNPIAASRLKNRFMRNPLSYNSVFSDDIPIQSWPVLVAITKKVEDVLSSARSRNEELGDRFLAKWRSLVSLICVARVLGTFDYSIGDLTAIHPSSIDEKLVSEVWGAIQSVAPSTKRPFRNPSFVIERCKDAAQTYGLAGLACVGRRGIPTGIPMVNLDLSFLAAVNELASKVPQGLDARQLIASQLNCSRGKVGRAISLLRFRGDYLGPGTPARTVAPPAGGAG